MAEMLSIIPKASPRSAARRYNSRQFKFRSGALNLGKGDKRTFRGKVFKGSHGKTRPRKPKKPAKKPA